MSDSDDDYNGCVDLDLWDDILKNGALKSPGVSVGSTPLDGFTTMSYVNAQNPPPNFELDVDGTTRIRGGLVIEDEDGEQIDVGEFMKTIGERLCVLQPNLEMNEHYPALKDAYDQYKMLEKLLMENNDDKKS